MRVSLNKIIWHFVFLMSGHQNVRLGFEGSFATHTIPRIVHPIIEIFEDKKLTRHFGYLKREGDQHVICTDREIGQGPIYAYVQRESVELFERFDRDDLLDNGPRLVRICEANGDLVLKFFDSMQQFYAEIDTDGFSSCFYEFHVVDAENILIDPDLVNVLGDQTVFLRLYKNIPDLLKRTEDMCNHACILYENGKLYSEWKLAIGDLGTYFITTPSRQIIQIEFALDEQKRCCGKFKLIRKCDINITNDQIQLDILYLDPECAKEFSYIFVEAGQAKILSPEEVEDQMFLYQKDADGGDPWLVLLTLEADGNLTLERFSRNQQRACAQFLV